MKRVLLLTVSIFLLTGCATAVTTNKQTTTNITIKTTNPIKTTSKKEETTIEMTTTIKPIGNKVVSKINYLDNGRAIYEVRGKVMTYIGAQVRYDGLTNRGEGEHFDPNAPLPLTKEEIKEYFVEAKKFGLNVLAISLDWRDLEKEKDVFTFDEIDMLMDLAQETDMKFEILWFSTNMCGDLHSFHIPDYIFDDDETYPKMIPNSGNYSGMYGYRTKYIVLDNPNLLEREYNAVKLLMNHIADYNTQKGYDYPVIGMQIHNESDGLLRWRYDQKEITLNGERVSKERLWEMTLNALNNVGMAVKDSNYVVVTRCNMTTSYGTSPFPQADFACPWDVYNLEGVDIIGDDPYTENTETFAKLINEYSENGNYAHVAENMGDYPMTDSYILKTVTNGGGYLIYDFATPEFFNYLNRGASYRMDQGIVNSDFTFKAHSQNAKDVISIINKAGYPLFTSLKEDMYSFNTGNIRNNEEVEEFTLRDVSYKMSTNTNGIGYVLKYDKGILVSCTSSAILEVLSGANMPKTAYEVSFDYNEMVKLNKVYPVENKITLEGLKLYYIPLK